MVVLCTLQNLILDIFLLQVVGLSENDSPSQGNAVHVTLGVSDVPGAKLPHSKISANKKDDLKRWLRCRGLPVGGNKKDLVEL